MESSFEIRTIVLKLMAAPKLVDTGEHFLHNLALKGGTRK